MNSELSILNGSNLITLRSVQLVSDLFVPVGNLQLKNNFIKYGSDDIFISIGRPKPFFFKYSP